jgi:hypothetical protein
MTGWLGGIVLLAGVLGVPLALLAMGHGLRRRGAVGRGAFWGGVAGYGVGLVVWVAVVVGDGSPWDTGSPRHVAVFVLLVAAGAGGAGVGLFRGWISRG